MGHGGGGSKCAVNCSRGRLARRPGSSGLCVVPPGLLETGAGGHCGTASGGPEYSTGPQPLPPRRGFRQLLATPALPLPLFVVSHLPTGCAPHPHRVDMVRHPYAGHRTDGEVWTKEPVHRFLVGATTEQLLGRLRVLPSGGRFPWSPGPRKSETPPFWHGAASLGAICLTWIEVRSDEEVNEVRDRSRPVVPWDVSNDKSAS